METVWPGSLMYNFNGKLEIYLPDLGFIGQQQRIVDNLNRAVVPKV